MRVSTCRVLEDETGVSCQSLHAPDCGVEDEPEAEDELEDEDGRCVVVGGVWLKYSSST